MPDDIIKVVNTTVKFGKNTVLNNISLEIKKGETFGIVGMSGSGKTTFLNTLIGIIDPQPGEVLFRFETKKGPETSFEYKPVTKDILKVRRLFGFAAQDPSFYMQLTVKENMEYFAAMYGLSAQVKKNNISTLLELVGLSHCQDLHAEQLSGGMKKRLDIACALVHNPEVLILDEPTADLDPLLREQMWDIIHKINKKGTTIILASHFLREMELLCHRIAILHNSKINTIGSPDYIRSVYTKNEEIHLETFPGKYDAIVEQLQKIKGLKMPKIINKGHKLIIYTPDSMNVLHHLLHAVEKQNEGLIDVDVHKPSLREVFESLIKREEKQIKNAKAADNNP
ncbi:MAG: ABC transporter ATP-binding protein [Candidatus Woesearchaeota archaeon]